jgi:hypothetical protein
MAPTTELADVACAGGGVRLAQEAFDLFTVLQFDTADSKWRWNSRDEAAERSDRHFPDLDLDRSARFGTK